MKKNHQPSSKKRNNKTSPFTVSIQELMDAKKEQQSKNKKQK